MKTIEEIRKELLVAKENIEEKLEILNRLEDEEEEGTVTLRIQYETEREETITIPQSKLCTIDKVALHIIGTTYNISITRRKFGPLAGKALYLNDSYHWELGADDEGVLCLVPIKKEEYEKNM
jgi:hypothetical protein